MPRIHWSSNCSRRLYYSIPAYKALPGTVGIAISGNPNLGNATATVIPPAGFTAKFAEVLQNTYQVKNFFKTTPFTCTVPLDNSMNAQGEMVCADSWGFYVTRVIDSQDRVGYSAPFLVEPPTNLVQNPGFEAQQASTQSPANWVTVGNNPEADYTETSYALEGNYHGTHFKNAAYSVATYQDITGLSSGAYTLKAWVKSSGGQTGATMEVKDGSTYTTVSIPSAGSNNNCMWRLITINNVNITNGQARIIFRSTADANQFIQFDNVWFYK